MTARILSGYRHELVWYPSTKLSGHVLAALVGGVLAVVVALGWGL